MQMRVKRHQTIQLQRIRKSYTCPWHSTVKWPASSMTIPKLVALEPWRLPWFYQTIFIGLHWSQKYGSKLLAVRCTTQSMQYIAHALNLTCHCHHLLVPGSNLPYSKALGYTIILVINDYLTEMAIYLICRRVMESPELAWMFFK